MTITQPDLQSWLEQYLEKHQGQGIQLAMDSPKFDISWQMACGDTGGAQDHPAEKLSHRHPLRIASVGKTFTAAAILRLWEQQKLDLDQSIDAYLCSQHCSLLQAGGYALARITPRQLLSHTSGVYDYADSTAFKQAIFAAPQRHWTRSQQLELAIETGKPYGEPGEVYRYSDTGYILLGEIIEQITGQPLATALRQLLNYQSLGLTATYMEVAEPTPANSLRRIRQYGEGKDMTDVHGSFDIFGGGGLISSVDDMRGFIRGLLTGQVFTHASTLNTMLEKVPAKSGGPGYHGTGVQLPGTYRLGIDGGETGKVFLHAGYFGTVAAYIPAQDLAVGLSLTSPNKSAVKTLFSDLMNWLALPV